MKPDDPVTRTARSFVFSRGQLELRAEGVPVPVQVPRQPLRHLEVRGSVITLEPDRRDLRDRQPMTTRLRDELDTDLEARVRLDADRPDELRGVRLERVRRVSGPDSGEEVERDAGEA